MRTTRLLGTLATTAALLATTGCGAASPDEPAPPPTAAAVGPPPQRGNDLTTADVDAWLDGFVPGVLDRAGVPGATVAVVHDGEVVTTRGFGWADRTERVPVDPEQTLFRIGSVSKVFTATAVMQLVEQGDVDLDTDVTTYVDVALDRPVTLRQLLTHTGGFEEKVSGLILGPDATVDLEEALTTDPPEQVYEPGTVPAYSNYGNSLAGLVVQEVSGQAYEEYVAQHVLEPLGMSSSSLAQPLPGRLAGRLAEGYADGSTTATPFEVVGSPPAGAMTSSAEDMARFMLAQLGDGPALLRPETLAQMHEPALDASSLGTLAEGPRMTLGFFDRSRNGHRALEHGGDTTVFHSDLELWPDDGTGIFVSANGSGTTATATADLREGLLDGFADRYLPGDAPAPAPPADASAAAAVAYAAAGTYESSSTVRSNFLAAAYAIGRTTVEARDGGRLLLSPGPDATEPALFEPVGPHTWREVDGDREIAVRLDDAGVVEAIGFDNAFALLPVPAERSPAALLAVGASALVLLLAAVGWLLSRPVRWVRRAPRRAGAGRVARVLTRIGVASAALAVTGWVVVVVQVMGLGAPPSLTAVRVVQLLQLVGVLAVVPATVRLVGEVRRRSGRWHVVSAALVLLALVGVGWGAVTLRLLAPDVTY